MSRTYIVNACRVVSVAGNLSLATGSGSCRVEYSRGQTDTTGSYTPLAGEQTHELTLPVGSAGLIATAQEVVQAIAQAEGLDPSQGDTIQ